MCNWNGVSARSSTSCGRVSSIPLSAVLVAQAWWGEGALKCQHQACHERHQLLL